MDSSGEGVVEFFKKIAPNCHPRRRQFGGGNKKGCDLPPFFALLALNNLNIVDGEKMLGECYEFSCQSLCVVLTFARIIYLCIKIAR